jgi:hypothetical protein
MSNMRAGHGDGYVTAVAVLADGDTLRLAFDDGLFGEVRVSDLALKYPYLWNVHAAAASLDEVAGTVVWPDGTTIAPELLHDAAAGHAIPPWSHPRRVGWWTLLQRAVSRESSSRLDSGTR